jgi:hypothetical protein
MNREWGRSGQAEQLDALTSASDADIARVARPWVTTRVNLPSSTPRHPPG